MPITAIAAAVLVAEGLRLLVVGTTGLRLHGEPVEVHDLDLVIEPSSANLGLLEGALASLGARTADMPPVCALEQADIVTVTTRYGPVDLLLGQGRRSFTPLADRAVVVRIFGVGVPLASSADTWSLRARYKDPAALQ